MIEKYAILLKEKWKCLKFVSAKKGMFIVMYYIGIDLGGTNVAVGIVTEEGRIIAKKSFKTAAERPFEEIIKDMADCIEVLLSENKISLDEIESIGIGSPGNVNSETGVLVYANNFAHGKNVPMRTLLQQYIHKPVILGNDANVAALGEVLAGAGKGYSNVVMITLGTGVGGGIVIDKKIYEGEYSAGAELGHICICHGGETCSCGRKGCWEAYASATALIRQTKAAMQANPDSLMNQTATLDKISGRTAFDAAKKGDPAAQEVVDRYIEYIAEGLTDICNIFRPEILIIGGGICNEGDYLLKPIQAFVDSYIYGGERNPKQRIAVAALGNDAGIIGAALNRR